MDWPQELPMVHRASDTAAKLIAARFPPLLLDHAGREVDAYALAQRGTLVVIANDGQSTNRDAILNLCALQGLPTRKRDCGRVVDSIVDVMQLVSSLDATWIVLEPESREAEVS